MLAREDCVICMGKQENNDTGHFKKPCVMFSVATYVLGYTQSCWGISKGVSDMLPICQR